MPVASTTSALVAAVQLVAVGKKLIHLLKTGKIDEAEFNRRWNANASNLLDLEESWIARQREKENANSRG